MDDQTLNYWLFPEIKTKSNRISRYFLICYVFAFCLKRPIMLPRLGFVCSGPKKSIGIRVFRNNKIHLNKINKIWFFAYRKNTFSPQFSSESKEHAGTHKMLAFFEESLHWNWIKWRAKIIRNMGYGVLFDENVRLLVFLYYAVKERPISPYLITLQ